MAAASGSKRWGNISPTDNNRVRLEDLVDILQLPKKKWVQVRFLDTDILPVKVHWINIITGKTKKELAIPKYCVSFDTQTEADVPDVHCPYCELPSDQARVQKFYLANAIIRDLQEDEPAKKSRPTTKEKSTGFKSHDSTTWTPVRVVRIPMSLAKKIQELSALNKVKNRTTGQTTCHDVSHDTYGADVNIKFDPDASGADMYSVQLAERTKLTDVEKEYLFYDLSDSLITECGRETPEAARKEVSRMDLNSVETEEDDKSKSKQSSKSKPAANKTKAKSQAAHIDLDDDDDDDDDLGIEDDEEEEDDTPPPKKNSKPAAKQQSTQKKRPAPPVDDDEEEEEEDEEDEEEDDDLGIDDDDEEDEEEDDTPPPPPKKTAKPVSKPAAKPAAKPVAKKQPATAQKKRPPAPVADDDDDEDPF